MSDLLKEAIADAKAVLVRNLVELLQVRRLSRKRIKLQTVSENLLV